MVVPGRLVRGEEVCCVGVAEEMTPEEDTASRM